MNNFILMGLTAISLFITIYLFYEDKQKNIEKYNKTRTVNENLIKIYFIVILISNLVIAYLLPINDFFYNFPYQIKVMVLLSIMAVVLVTDFYSFRIPNTFIIYGLVARVLILAYEFIKTSDILGIVIKNEIIGALALLFCGILCNVVIKNSLGYGDIKLFILMGLFLGLSNVWNAMIVSLIISFFVSVYVLLVKKMKKNDIIPFAPSIAIGTFLTVLLMMR